MKLYIGWPGYSGIKTFTDSPLYEAAVFPHAVLLTMAGKRLRSEASFVRTRASACSKYMCNLNTVILEDTLEHFACSRRVQNRHSFYFSGGTSSLLTRTERRIAYRRSCGGHPLFSRPFQRRCPSLFPVSSLNVHERHD